MPGADLVHALNVLTGAGRPAWQVPGSVLRVPRLIPELPDRGREFTLPLVWAALHGHAVDPLDKWAYPPPDPRPKDWRRDPREDPSAQKQAIELIAAAMRDIAGMRPEQVGNKIALVRGADYQYDRSVRRVIREGRELWARLDAWPWTVVDEYEADWWLREDVTELWALWRNPASRQQLLTADERPKPLA